MASVLPYPSKFQDVRHTFFDSDFCLDTTYRHPASSNDVTRTPRVWIPLTTLAVVLPRHIDVWQTRGQEHLKKCGWHLSGSRMAAL
ncbi:hypothetical protein IW261DRAFT_1565073 [Armillaria novae-zelandiae]|uniref:Uncharacterized protein n=1 Tax=Armillaria novae-zelandiae TaxID=153914 RepID=A0AA39P8R0_9AGAR|nr:hypothetical protein IW261DRAFT_1565073 [Armillaria novae-zelandiae]